MTVLSLSTPISSLDWSVICVYMVVTLIIGVLVSKWSSKSLADYFVAGRSLPWFLAGTSLIATSFASDTPLWVSGLVRKYGVHTAWQFWGTAFGAGIAVYVFAGLWRRLGVMTDLEFIEIRYEGRAAAWLRGFFALYLSVFFNSLVIGWVTKAMQMILAETLGLTGASNFIAVAIAIGIALVYCSLAGLWGVVVTDLLQWVLGTVGTILLAIYAVRAVGGLDELVRGLQGMSLNEWPGRELALAPEIGPQEEGKLSIWNAINFAFLACVPLAVASGYLAQRILATKDERHAKLSMLMYTVVYWGFNAWPWILVGLCSLILLPGFDGGPAEERAYPHMIIHYLPNGLRGMLLVAMFAAFMSTISTLINWGASYFVSDFYKRFVVRHQTERHYVRSARLVTVLISVLGGAVAFWADSIQTLLQIGGMVAIPMAVLLVIRWFWWRMTAWSELAGVIACFIVTILIVFRLLNGPAERIFNISEFHSNYDYFGLRVILVIIVSVLVTFAVALLDKPVRDEHLCEFLQRARPFKVFWRPVLKRTGTDYPEAISPIAALGGWVVVTICILSLIFGLGQLLLGSPVIGAISLLVSGACLVLSIVMINRTSHTS